MSEGFQSGGFDVEVECPACGNRFDVPRIRRGGTEICPVCRFKVLVPGGDAYEEQAAPQAAEEPVARPLAAHAAPPAAAPATQTGLYFVCTQDDVRFNPMAVAPIVGDLTGHSELETKMQVTRGQGVLAKQVPAETAHEIAQRLTAIQVPSFAVDEGCVPEAGRKLKIIRVHDLGRDAIQFQTSPRPDIQSVPWAAVASVFCTKERVVTGGPTDLKVERHVDLMTGAALMGVSGMVAPTPMRTTFRAQARRREPDIACTLLLQGRSGSVYSVRFDETQVRYTCLGSRTGPSRTQNFCRLIGDIIARSPQGFFPGSTRAVAAGQAAKVAPLRQSEDYRRYLHWVLCCVGRNWYGPAQAV